MPAPSVKKGRRSGRNSGNRVKLMTWRSTSACAKSAFVVRSSVRPREGASLASTPNAPFRPMSPVLSAVPFDS